MTETLKRISIPSYSDWKYKRKQIKELETQKIEAWREYKFARQKQRDAQLSRRSQVAKDACAEVQNALHEHMRVSNLLDALRG